MDTYASSNGHQEGPKYLLMKPKCDQPSKSTACWISRTSN